MTFDELKNCNRAEITLLYIYSQLLFYRCELIKVSVYQFKNKYNELNSIISFYMRDLKGNVHHKSVNYLNEDMSREVIEKTEKDFPMLSIKYAFGDNTENVPYTGSNNTAE